VKGMVISMIKDSRKYIILFLFGILSAIFVNPMEIKAASAKVELTSDTYKATIGEELIIYINITSDTEFKDFEANLLYDEEVLEYQSGASFIAGSNGFLKISDRGRAEDELNRKYALKFKALKVGNSKISFSGRVMVYDAENGLEMSVSANEIDIKVTAAQTASDNAKLKSLKISPSTLTPEFSPEHYEYTTTVGYENSKLIINAVPEDEKAKITIIGNDSFKEGENKVTISVLAESGTIIEYNINVLREAKSESHDSDEVIDSIEQVAKTFDLIMEDNSIYAVYGGKIEIIEPGSEVEIPQGYIKTRLIISETSITAFAKEENLDSDFMLIYAKNDQGVESFYKYDKVDKTIQRYAPDIIEIPSEIETKNPTDHDLSQEYKSNMMKAVVVIALLVGLCAILLIVLINMYMKLKGYKEDNIL